MIRVLQIIGSMDRAGAETVVMNLYRKLDKTKYQFDFVYFKNKKCDYDEEILSLGGRIFIIDKKSAFSRTFSIYRLIRRESTHSIIHSHTLFSSAFHIVAAYFAGVKKRIVHSHSTGSKSKGFFNEKIYFPFARILIKKYATDFLACGKEAGNFLFSSVDREKVHDFPNAIDISTFLQKKGDRNYIRRLLGISANSVILIQVGRLFRVKNHEFSINFAKFLRAKKQNFHFVFVGGGEMHEELEQMAKDLGVDENISFLGVRSDIPELLGGSDVMFMPSLHEGFPVVLVESQVIGTPALISDRISQEVDLDVNKVRFVDLNSHFDIWLEQLNLLVAQANTSDEEKRILTI